MAAIQEIYTTFNGDTAATREIHSMVDWESDSETPIQQFYNKKSIFLTGATGFLGKVIIDKLLRVCEIENFYVLIRNKKGKGVHSRLEEIFDDPLFDRLKKEKPKFRSKVCPIAGDCILPGLGINQADRALLKREVNVVFHVAATVRFDEKLKLALGINVNGTREILQLCKEIERLAAVIHVSTAYANCNREKIEEKFYKPKISGDNAIRLAECLDEKLLDSITPELIQGFPNTYTFTKCLAEDLVRTHGSSLPIAVYRPAIVIPTYEDPCSGWIDNHFGPTGIIVGVGAGLLRILYIHKWNNAEIVPVDMCVNSMLASAWDIAKNKYEQIPVYNYVTARNNPISWDDYCNLGIKHGSKVPPMRSLWFYTFTMCPYLLQSRMLQFFYHFVPAFFMDCGLVVAGKKAKMIKIYQKIHRFCDVIAYFTNHKWYWNNSNVQSLWDKLEPKDKEMFYFDMGSLDWDDMLAKQMIGMRTYLMKDDPSTIPDAIKRMARLKALHYTFIYTLRAVLLYVFYIVIFKMFFS